MSSPRTPPPLPNRSLDRSTAHGVSGASSRHDNLIKFDITIVGGRRQYVDTGQFSGSCTLVCHGVHHVNFMY